MFNNKRNKKGFTLVEVLVVVLIIGILAAIAVPSYNFAVEKTRAKQGITTLAQIAKAQVSYNARMGNYSETMLPLPLEIKDQDGSEASGSEFADKFFNYEVFGDDESASVARRNNGEYELSINYATGKLFCRPIEHKVCRDLNLDEGRSYGPPEWEDCAGALDPLWNSFAQNDNKESRSYHCQIQNYTKKDMINFEICFNAGGMVSWYSLPTTSRSQSVSSHACYSGSFLGDNTFVLRQCGMEPGVSCGAPILIKKNPDKSAIKLECLSWNEEERTCSRGDIGYYKNAGFQANGTCEEFDADGYCVNITNPNGRSQTELQNSNFSFGNY